jgi:NADH-quinone oxidoreductase subunit H
VIAGWASNNNWSLLGGLRASAQMISYEVTMGLSVTGCFMVYQTLKLTDMATAQDTTFRLFGFLERLVAPEVFSWLALVQVPQWGIFLQPLGFIMFLTCMMAENKRPPFDLPEGESELIAGYHLEYSGMRFGLFFMSEFIGVVVIAGIITTLFLGGWSVPWLSQQTLVAFLAHGTVPFAATGTALFAGMGEGFANGLCMLIHFATFFAKVVAMIWLQMALRWTLPRFRYDQVMDLCWKIMLPLSLLNIFVTGAVMLLVRG